MKNGVELPKNVGIIAHGDADGICAAALIKTIHPGALVMFSKASKLHKIMKEIERRVKTMDILYIVDVAISNRSKEYVMERIKTSSSRYKIVYYDNHILPTGIEQEELTKYVDYLSDRDSSSSVIAFTELYGNGDAVKTNYLQAMLATYGAIADYARESPFLKSMLDLYDESNTYFQAFLLKQASRVIADDEMKRTIVDKLSVGILPSEIFEVVEASRMASREVSVAVKFIMKYAYKQGPLGIIFECPIASMGHNAYMAATMTNAPVGVSIRRQGGKAYFVLRRKQDCQINLGDMANTVAQIHKCDGGGEEATAGITVTDTKIDKILLEIVKQLENEIGG